MMTVCRELLLQGWMKPGREDSAPNVALISKRFNEVRRSMTGFVLKVVHLWLFLDVSISDYRNSFAAINQWPSSMH